MMSKKPSYFVAFLNLSLIAVIVYWAITDNYLRDFLGIEEEKPVVEKKIEKPKPVNTFKIDKPTEKSIALGKAKYDMLCFSCHGKEGNGDGLKSDPPPRNFHKVENYKFGTSYQDIFNTITKGSPGTSMAPYGFLPESERIAITHYVSQWVPADKRVAKKKASEKKEKELEKPKVKVTDEIMDKVIEKMLL
jgi:mono/diheme cytochrome c family protein